MKVMYLPVGGTTIEIHQDTTVDIDLNKNTAYKVWDGSFLLAKHLEDKKYFKEGYFSKKRCIELGAGCGLVSLAAWLLGAHVLVTDLMECLSHTRKCVDINIHCLCSTDTRQKHQSEIGKNMDTDCNNESKLNYHPAVRADHLNPEDIIVMPYTWGTDPSTLGPPFDVILASDIIYKPGLTDDIIKSLTLLSHAGTVLLLSYKPRALGEDIFFHRLKSEGYHCQVIPSEDHPSEFKSSSYNLFHICKVTNS